MGPTSGDGTRGFWRDALSLGSLASRPILVRLAIVGAFAWLVCGNRWIGHHHEVLEVGLAPYEAAGAALGLLLVLRTNAGHDRWWEGRKLWGGIVNQSRRLAVVSIAYGPDDPAWRARAVGLIAAFAHAARSSLRGGREVVEASVLLGADEAAAIAGARHMPTDVILRIADHLRLACDRYGMDRFSFQAADRELATLLEHIGGCERIKKTPLPRAYAILIRQFILLFLLTLPFALLKKVDWLTPIVAMLVAYPILALDEIGASLQSPFDGTGPNRLPLDEICATIEADLLALLRSKPDR